MVRGRPEPDSRLIRRVADVALSLPDAYEEDAWTGVRWRVRQRTFAHVVALRVEEEKPAEAVAAEAAATPAEPELIKKGKKETEEGEEGEEAAPAEKEKKK